MGRLPWTNRNTVEESKVLEISLLIRNGFFCGARSGLITWKNGEKVTGSVSLEVSIEHGLLSADCARLRYSTFNGPADEAIDLNYSVGLVTTQCNYGGVRWWFVCPGPNCGRRVGKLYLPARAAEFWCRNCHDLTYESCRESHGWAYRFAKRYGLTLGQLQRGLRS